MVGCSKLRQRTSIFCDNNVRGRLSDSKLVGEKNPKIQRSTSQTITV